MSERNLVASENGTKSQSSQSDGQDGQDASSEDSGGAPLSAETGHASIAAADPTKGTRVNT
jgi:hypothetical protein